MNIKNLRFFKRISLFLILISCTYMVQAQEKKDNAILCLISVSENITVDSVDGKETLATAKEVFPTRDYKFKDWNTDKAGVATKEIEVQVYEMVQNATPSQLFDSFGTNLDKLCLTQAQIKNFCKKHFNWLCKKGNATLFLFKVEDQFFIADVGVFNSGSLVGVRVYKFHGEDDGTWPAENAHRVVVPKINL